MKTKYILIVVALGICISIGVQHLSADDQQYVEIPGILNHVYLGGGTWCLVCDCSLIPIVSECWCQKFIPPGNGT